MSGNEYIWPFAYGRTHARVCTVYGVCAVCDGRHDVDHEKNNNEHHRSQNHNSRRLWNGVLSEGIDQYVRRVLRLQQRAGGVRYMRRSKQHCVSRLQRRLHVPCSNTGNRVCCWHVFSGWENRVHNVWRQYVCRRGCVHRVPFVSGQFNFCSGRDLVAAVQL